MAAKLTVARSIGTLPFAAFVVVAINAFYMTFVAFGNITDPDTNKPFVEHVLSMDTTNFGAGEGVNLDPDTMWRAIENPTIHTIAYIGLIVWETLAALVLLWAIVWWVRGIRGAGFELARRWSTIGLLMIVILFFCGFITIGGEWFQMWKSVEWNGLEPAFRNSVLALFGIVLCYLPSRDWGEDIAAVER